ncbi:MAG: TolC family protein [Candidatus Brocadiia bacterium]
MRDLLLTSFVLALATLGCVRTSAPPARQVRAALEEAERAQLYSQLEGQGLWDVEENGSGPAPARLYVFDRRAEELTEVEDRERLKDILKDGQALIRVSPARHGPTLQMWNWTKGQTSPVSLRLDSLCAHELPTSEGEDRLFDVLFTGREHALFPFCAEDDLEIFKARLSMQRDSGKLGLLDVRQMTHNRWDDFEPAFSPDGQWIVYTSARDGVRNVALMDRNGDFLRLLTRKERHGAYHPAVLPDNEQCLYVAGTNGTEEYFICGLDGAGHRRASDAELRRLLFSWDDATRHRYIVSDAFALSHEMRLLMELPRRLGLEELILLAEWNAPGLQQYRETILAAQAEREGNKMGRGPRVGLGATHVLDTGVLRSEPDESPSDRPVENFTRYLFSLSLPLFTGPLDRAIEQRDRWQEIVYSQTYRKRYSELVYEVARAYFSYSEHTVRAQLLRRVLELNLKRKFLWETRAAAGLELEDRIRQAEALIAEARADIADAEGKARLARGRLLATVGLEPGYDIDIVPSALSAHDLSPKPPSLERAQALARVNHPDLARLKFLELRAAAIRDMGPPETRSRPTLHVNYGLGNEHFFSQAVDDFISLGLTHALPLDALGLEASYREQWTHEMRAFREERHQAALDISVDLQETHAAIQRLKQYLEAALKWEDAAAEKVRLSRIYRGQQPVPDSRPHPVAELIDARIEHLEQRMAAASARADLLRHLAQYYHRAGLARRLLSALTKGSEPEPSGCRSVWLWESLEIVLDPDKRSRLLDTCAEHGITRLYCFVSRVEGDLYLDRYGWEFGRLLDLCERNGIRVYALVGNPRWLRSSYREEIGAILQSVLEFNDRRAEGRAAFAGIKLDVEPHALPGWQQPERRGELAGAYLEMLDYIRAQLGRRGRELALAADVSPDWRSAETERGNLLSQAAEKLDEVTVMAYRDTAEEVIERARPALEVTRSQGVPVEVGIETAEVEQPGISMANRPMGEILLALERVYAGLAEFPNFRGFAIHDYSGLAEAIEESYGR